MSDKPELTEREQRLGTALAEIAARASIELESPVSPAALLERGRILAFLQSTLMAQAGEESPVMIEFVGPKEPDEKTRRLICQVTTSVIMGLIEAIEHGAQDEMQVKLVRAEGPATRQ
jgi:hypothetical protein